jgi:transcriptional regulator with XRE-family HTH domain
MHERRARLQPGADWLRAERERRSWSQRELAERITGAGFEVKQDRISVYENAQDEPRPEFREAYGRALAAVLGINEVEAYKGLGWPMPSEEALADYYQTKYPGVFKRVAELTGENTDRDADTPGPGDGHARVTRKPVARKSGEEPRKPRRRASGG